MEESTGLKVIAERLNLAESTVSRALNDYRDISENTKTIVRELASELKYEPNKHARRLALGKSDTIGFLMPKREGQLTETCLSELVVGIADTLANWGWDLMVLAPRSTEDELAMFQKIARTRHISGIIISRTFENDARLRILRDLKIPFISHGRSNDSSNTAWLDVDNELAFIEIVTHLASLGHRRIAHIGGSSDYNFAVQRARGWKRGLSQIGLLPLAGYNETSKLSFEGGQAAMKRLISLPEPPTAVCCVSDVVAIGAMKALRDAGFRPGHEVSIIGYDGLEIGALLDPPLTTMQQPIETTGQKLAEMLISIVEGESTPPNNQALFRASLVRRGTVNPPLEGEPRS